MTETTQNTQAIDAARQRLHDAYRNYLRYRDPSHLQAAYDAMADLRELGVRK